MVARNRRFRLLLGPSCRGLACLSGAKARRGFSIRRSSWCACRCPPIPPTRRPRRSSPASTIPHFMVKEVDLGELGAEQLSIIPIASGQAAGLQARESPMESSSRRTTGAAISGASRAAMSSSAPKMAGTAAWALPSSPPGCQETVRGCRQDLALDPAESRRPHLALSAGL